MVESVRGETSNGTLILDCQVSSVSRIAASELFNMVEHSLSWTWFKTKSAILCDRMSATRDRHLGGNSWPDSFMRGPAIAKDGTRRTSEYLHILSAHSERHKIMRLTQQSFASSRGCSKT